jgi:hypothetical protein
LYRSSAYMSSDYFRAMSISALGLSDHPLGCLTIAVNLVYNARVLPKPTPISDLASYLKSSGMPRTKENILRVAKMLSMTEAETQLALMLVDPKAVES